MSLDKITNEILAEANLEKEKLINEAKAQADEIIKEANMKAEKMINDAKDKGREEKEKIIERRRVIVNVDKRKLLLEKKQEVLKNTYEKAGVSYEENKRELASEVAKILF